MKKVKAEAQQLRVRNVDVFYILRKALGDSLYMKCESEFKAAVNSYTHGLVFNEQRTSCMTLSGKNGDLDDATIQAVGAPVDDSLVASYSSAEYDPSTKLTRPIQAYGVCPVPPTYKVKYATIARNMWHYLSYIPGAKMQEHFGLATYKKAWQHAAAHATILDKAKATCEYKWMGISISACYAPCGKNVYLHARVPRSQKPSFMDAYAHVIVDEDSHAGNFKVKTGYCICPLGIDGMCSHVAALVWITVQQRNWATVNDMERYKHDSIVDKSIDLDSVVACTSKLSKWNVPSFPSGDIPEDVKRPVYMTIIENPHTVAIKQELWVERMNADKENVDPNTKVKRERAPGLQPRKVKRTAMLPLQDIVFNPLPYDGDDEEFLALRDQHWSLLDDVAARFNLLEQ